MWYARPSPTEPDAAPTLRLMLSRVLYVLGIVAAIVALLAALHVIGVGWVIPAVVAVILLLAAYAVGTRSGRPLV